MEFEIKCVFAGNIENVGNLVNEHGVQVVEEQTLMLNLGLSVCIRIS